MYVYNTIASFIWRGVDIAHVSPTTSMFVTNSMLLCWKLDSVPLPVAIKPKVVNEALQWRSERPAQVRSSVNQTELTSELNLQYNYFTLVEGTTLSFEELLTWRKLLT